MKIGMLWFDNDPKTDLTTKIQEAAAYYHKKYAAQPDLCYVHPSMVAVKPASNGIEVRTARDVMPNHIWIGVHEDRAAQQQQLQFEFNQLAR
jgi:hypothetical protein